MKTVGYYNGQIDEIDALRVPLLDRAYYFGDGVYDAACTQNYRVFALDDHIERFYNSARLINIQVPMEKAALGALLCGLARRLDAPDAMLYWQISRGTAPRNHAFPENAVPNLMIMVTPKKVADLHTPLRMVTTEDIRYSMCNVKTLNLLPNVLASQKAKEAGCDGCIFVRQGIVTECDHSNVHILSAGRLVTHPTDCRILPGIARKHLISVCGQIGIPVDERPFTYEEMLAADEVLVSSTTQLVRPASEVDGQPVGGSSPDLARLLTAVRAEFDEGTRV